MFAADAVDASLTASERRVVELVARGWTNREVADALNLRPKTIEWALTKVYRKLEVRSRTELVLKLPSIPGLSLDETRNRRPFVTVIQSGRVDDRATELPRST